MQIIVTAISAADQTIRPTVASVEISKKVSQGVVGACCSWMTYLCSLGLTIREPPEFA